MNEGTVLLIAILLAAAIVALGTAFSLAEHRPPNSGRRQPKGVAAKVFCPAISDVVRVEMAPDPAAPGAIDLLWCERFPDGPISCDRGCLAVQAT